MSLLLMVSMFISVMPMQQRALADAGDTPAHAKTLTDNQDGTYQLELSVTGDADTEVETAANVNVLIIYDESSSMTSNNVTTGPNRNRADYAEDVVHDFVDSLSQYQSGDGSNIEVAVVGFGPSATTRQNWTSDLTGGNNGVNRLFDDGVDGTVTSTHNYTSNNGTNWQAALNQAQTLLTALDNREDTDPTFVILVTDGAPTAASGQTTINPAGNRPWTDFRVYYNAATQTANSIQSRDDTTLFGIYAYGREADLLDDLIYYSNAGSHRVVDGYNISTCTAAQHNFGATETVDNYYNAADTSALNAAIEDIFQKIVNALGITSVAVRDGTTNQVETTSGEISELLEVDESSYQYWLSIPVVNNRYTRIALSGENQGEEIEYIVTDNGDGTCTVTGGGNTVTVNGSVSGGQFKYEWTEKNALYNYDPPAAQLTNGAVDWNLNPVGTLLDGVTYSVTFDVYPSQTTLDIVADIKNDPGANGAWGDLDSEIQKYIDVNGNLKTNTGATLTYSDTRLDNPGPKTTGFTDPDPVENSAVEQLAVTKQWENELDSQNEPPVTLNVTRDGANTYTVELSSGNNWSDSVYISVGILKDGAPLPGSEGHDFTFTEPAELGYYWELDVPTVHPMLINNVRTMLVKVDEKHPLPDGAESYNFNNATYYVDESIVALTAINTRRSWLDVNKVVVGDAADPDQTFPFTLNVVNANAADGSADDLNSDYYVWFSVWNGGFVDANVTGAQKEMENGEWTGYYYAPSGSDFGLELKVGDGLRVLNLPSGSTYTITEGTLPTGYSFTSSELTSGEDETFSGAQTTTGTIETTNTDYTVTYTNTYELADVVIEKTFEGIGEELIPDDFAITAVIGNETKTLTVEDEDVVKDGLKYTWSFTGLPLDTVVSVSEDGTDIAGYELTSTMNPASGSVTLEEASVYTIALNNSYTQKFGEDVVEKPHYVIKKVDQDNNPLSGVKFSMTNGQTVVWEGTTNASGEAAVNFDAFTFAKNEAPTETYTFTLTETPKTGYTGAGPWTVTVGEDDGEVEIRLNEELNVFQKIWAWIIKTFTSQSESYSWDGEALLLTVTNPINEYDVTVTKTFSGITSDLIPEDFAINVTYGENNSLTLTTSDRNVEVSSDGLTYTWTIEDIAYGTELSFSETGLEIEGYTLQDSAVTSGTLTVSEVEENNVFELSNPYEVNTYDVTVKKVFSGIPTDLLPSGFQIAADYNNTVLTLAGGTASADGLTYTWTIEDVPFGTEINFTESGEEVDRYTLSANAVKEAELTVVVPESDTDNTATLVNPYSQDLGELEIVKALADSSAQVDVPTQATFTVTGPDDFSLTVTYDLFTDGSYVIENLPTGDYTVVETNAAIDGYELSTVYSGNGSATVNKGERAMITVTNKYDKKTDTDRIDNFVEITKVDQDGNELEGATFTLSTSDGTKVADYSAGTARISTDDEALANYLPEPDASITLTIKETQAPEGYELDPTEYPVTIAATAEEKLTDGVFVTTTTYTITIGNGEQQAITNTKITSTDRVDDTVKIVKVDQDGNDLSGATFSLKGEDIDTTFTAGTATISTGSSGSDVNLNLKELKDGESKTYTFTVKETKAPAGYELDETEHTVTVTATAEEALTDGVFVTTTTFEMTIDGGDSITVTNTKKTDTARVDDKITLEKLDQDGEPLDGATFSLSGDGVDKSFTAGTVVISTTNDGDVNLDLPDLEDGQSKTLTLTLTETEAPDGYQKDETEFTLTITGKGEEALDSEKDLWITTTTYSIAVKEHAAPAANQESDAKEEKTDTDVKAEDSAEQPTEGGDAPADQPTEEGTTPAEEGEQPSDDQNATADGEQTNNGDASTEGGEQQNADAEEGSDEGDPAEKEPAEEEAPAEKPEKLTVTNTKITGSERVDDDATIEKVDQDGNTLDGATFTLSAVDDEGNKTTITTYTAGTATISTKDEALKDYLPAAGETVTLKLQETEAPEGYEKDDTEYDVVISATEEEALTDHKFITTTTYEMTINDSTSVTVKNTKKTDTARVDNSIKINKVDQDGNALDGATFTLSTEDGTEVATYTAGTATISTKDEALANYLPKDGESVTLKLQETEAPKGYKPSETIYSVKISASASEALTDGVFVTTTTYTISISDAEEQTVSNTKVTENRRVDDSIVFNKVDDKGNALTGATFSLRTQDGTEITTYSAGSVTVSTADEALANYLPENGQSVTLILKETAAPQGYKMDATEYKIEIGMQSEEALEDNVFVTTVTYTMTINGAEEQNIVNPKNSGTDTEHDSIALTKVNSFGKVIEGAVFSLKTESGAQIATYTVGARTISTSDSELSAYLPVSGSTTVLYLQEISAPAGYILDKTEHKVVITASTRQSVKNDVFVTTTSYSITVDGTKSLVVTNRSSDNPPPPPFIPDSPSPRTGDTANLILWCALIAASVIGLVVFAARSRKGRYASRNQK